MELTIARQNGYSTEYEMYGMPLKMEINGKGTRRQYFVIQGPSRLDVPYALEVINYLRKTDPNGEKPPVFAFGKGTFEKREYSQPLYFETVTRDVGEIGVMGIYLRNSSPYTTVSWGHGRWPHVFQAGKPWFSIESSRKTLQDNTIDIVEMMLGYPLSDLTDTFKEFEKQLI
ncbi:MAG: hypothetical protein HYW23_01275 [Candidatus Aenigmarchaeota archaeon]|nr:hypothetical protein [Candidatus Aenigmarchaeota archaeon]